MTTTHAKAVIDAVIADEPWRFEDATVYVTGIDSWLPRLREDYVWMTKPLCPSSTPFYVHEELPDRS